MLYRFVVSLILLSLSFVSSALELELTQGISSALPIAVSDFNQSGGQENLAQIISNDLQLSGQFRLIDAAQNQPLQALRRMGADTVVVGKVLPASGGRYSIDVELLDAVNQGQKLLNLHYEVGAGQFRSLAHHMADQIYQKLTGEKGVFSTRIAYILVKNQGKQKRFSLEVADMDGHRPHTLVVSTEPLMSPSWSPDARQIAYVSFEKKRAQVYTVNVESGQRRLITSFSGINNAPSWSPDGREMAVVLSKDGNPNIYAIDLSSGRLRQLTKGYAIDTEPRYAPDGKSLLFTSGRGGSPQIYQLSFADGSIRRLSFQGDYNARSSYTPDQRNIVMMHRQNGRFSIAIQPSNSGSVRSITNAAMDESPSVSPNGRLIIYATRFQERGVLGIVSTDGRIHLRLPAREGDVQEPAWSPFV